MSTTSAQTELRRRIAESSAASNAGQRRVGNQAALDELPHHRPHPPVDDQFRHDQQRHRQQKAGVLLDVVEERQRDARPRRVLPAIDSTSSGAQASSVSTTMRRRSNCSASPARRVRRQI